MWYGTQVTVMDCEPPSQLVIKLGKNVINKFISFLNTNQMMYLYMVYLTLICYVEMNLGYSQIDISLLIKFEKITGQFVVSIIKTPRLTIESS